jgi:hypothetical protein
MNVIPIKQQNHKDHTGQQSTSYLIARYNESKRVKNMLHKSTEPENLTNIE